MGISQEGSHLLAIQDGLFECSLIREYNRSEVFPQLIEWCSIAMLCDTASTMTKRYRTESSGTVVTRTESSGTVATRTESSGTAVARTESSGLSLLLIFKGVKGRGV